MRPSALAAPAASARTTRSIRMNRDPLTSTLRGAARSSRRRAGRPAATAPGCSQRVDRLEMPAPSPKAAHRLGAGHVAGARRVRRCRARGRSRRPRGETPVPGHRPRPCRRAPAAAAPARRPARRSPPAPNRDWRCSCRRSARSRRGPRRRRRRPDDRRGTASRPGGDGRPPARRSHGSRRPRPARCGRCADRRSPARCSTRLGRRCCASKRAGRRVGRGSDLAACGVEAERQDRTRTGEVAPDRGADVVAREHGDAVGRQRAEHRPVLDRPSPAAPERNSWCSRWALLTSATVGRDSAASQRDLADVVHAEFDDPGAMRQRAATEQGQRDADVVVQVAAGRERRVVADVRAPGSRRSSP